MAQPAELIGQVHLEEGDNLQIVGEPPPHLDAGARGRGRVEHLPHRRLSHRARGVEAPGRRGHQVHDLGLRERPGGATPERRVVLEGNPHRLAPEEPRALPRQRLRGRVNRTGGEAAEAALQGASQTGPLRGRAVQGGRRRGARRRTVEIEQLPEQPAVFAKVAGAGQQQISCGPVPSPGLRRAGELAVASGVRRGRRRRSGAPRPRGGCGPPPRGAAGPGTGGCRGRRRSP